MTNALDTTNIPRQSAKWQNIATFEDYYRRLRLLATSVFEWSNLPESVNERHLEQTLYKFGMALFFSDPDMSYLALQCVPSSMLNVYWEATAFTAVSVNYSKQYTMDNAVLIRNNYDLVPTEHTIRLFAERLTRAERVLDVNLMAQKTPLFIVCDEKQRLTMKNIFSQYEGNEPLIIGDKSLNPDFMRTVVTQAPFLLDKLIAYKQNIWDECMTFLGINTPGGNNAKAERMLVPEVNSNNQLIATSAQVMLMTRQLAAQQINDMFGLNVSVNMRETVDPALAQTPEEQTADKPAAQEGGASE
jgi:hypothetical protein